MELSTARGPQNASKIAAEFTAGVKNFDVFIGGSGTYESLVEGGMTEPLDTMMILPEVKKRRRTGGAAISGKITSARIAFSIHLSPTPARAASGTTPTLVKPD